MAKKAYLVIRGALFDENDKGYREGDEILLEKKAADVLLEKGIIGETEYDQLKGKTVPELQVVAARRGVVGYEQMLKDDLLEAITGQAAAPAPAPVDTKDNPKGAN